MGIKLRGFLLHRYISFFACLYFCSCLLSGFFVGGKPAKIPEDLTLTLELELARKVYGYSDYGEAPQIAVWLEQPDRGVIRTLFVSRRTASGKWLGKVECPLCLPYWVSRYNKETGTSRPPNPKNPLPDAVSGPTPRDRLCLQTRLPEGSRWFYFIEVNVSGDYNRHFPAARHDGTPDPQGNGQPSLVYRCEIKVRPGEKCQPQLIGRTDQFNPVDHLITDLSGITSAKKVLSNILVSVSRSPEKP